MPFVKGQSGNPSGKPSAIRQELQALLDKHYTSSKRKATLLRLIALTESEDEARALDAIRLLWAYTFGKPVERQEVSGPDGGPIAIDLQAKASAEIELAEWRKQQQELLSNTSSAMLTPPISSTPTDG